MSDKLKSRYNFAFNNQIKGTAGFHYQPAPQNLASPTVEGVQVQFYHIASGRYAEFAGFITNFSDSYASQWESQEAIGRMDPMMTFRNTTRTISLGFEVPSVSRDEAKSNTAEVNRLVQFQYPTYKPTNQGVLTMDGPPLIKVQFQNLIASHKYNGNMPAKGQTIDAQNEGVICAITSLSVTPDFEVGAFGSIPPPPPNVFFASFGSEDYEGRGQSFPKLWKIDLSMTVLHDHLPGYVYNSISGKYEYVAEAAPYGPGAREDVNASLGPEKDLKKNIAGLVPQSTAGDMGSAKQQVAEAVQKSAVGKLLNAMAIPIGDQDLVTANDVVAANNPGGTGGDGPPLIG